MNGYFTSIFSSGRRESLNKSILTLTAQIYLENTKEDTGQRKCLRNQQLALIISERRKMRTQEVRRETNFEKVLCEEVPVRIFPAPESHEDKGGGEGAWGPTSLLLVELLQKLLLPLDVLEQAQELRLLVLRQVPEFLSAEHQLLPHALLSALSLLELLAEPLELGLKIKKTFILT